MYIYIRMYVCMYVYISLFRYFNAPSFHQKCRALHTRIMQSKVGRYHTHSLSPSLPLCLSLTHTYTDTWPSSGATGSMHSSSRQHCDRVRARGVRFWREQLLLPPKSIGTLIEGRTAVCIKGGSIMMSRTLTGSSKKNKKKETRLARSTMFLLYRKKRAYARNHTHIHTISLSTQGGLPYNSECFSAQ